jgi:hypothetical protein
VTFKPNAPRMVTVVIAIVLLVVGVVGVFMPSLMNDAIKALPIGADLTKQLRELAHNDTLLYLCALASPVLLAIGSLLPGI